MIADDQPELPAAPLSESDALPTLMREAFFAGGVSLDRMIERFFDVEDAS